MSAWFIVVFILICFLPTYLSGTTKSPTGGPFKTTVLSVMTCESPYRPYMNDTPMSFTPLVHNSSTAVLLSGNVTILKDLKNVQYRMKASIWENNKWRPIYLLSDGGCHGWLLHLISTTTGIKYDKKNCMFLKGQYNFKNIDVNSFQHLWTSKMEYGKVLWRSEAFHQKQGTYFCHDYQTITEPI